MTDGQQTSAGSPPPKASLTVPDETKAQFGPLIELILASESMTDEERQYWINILPAMTPEQRNSLQEILVNERDQLKAIDAKYSQEISTLGEQKVLERMEIDRRSKREQRSSSEEQDRTHQDEQTQELMRKIQDS